MKNIDNVVEGYYSNAGAIALGMYTANKTIENPNAEVFYRVFMEEIKKLRLEFGVEEEEGK